MKTLTFFKPILFFFLLISIAGACKKDTKVFSIEGNWAGTYTDTNYPLKMNVQLENSAKTIVLMDSPDEPNKVTGNGSWELTDDIFTADITFLASPNTHFLFKATFDNKSGTLVNGTWGVSPNSSGSGTWQMVKQP